MWRNIEDSKVNLMSVNINFHIHAGMFIMICKKIKIKNVHNLLMLHIKVEHNIQIKVIQYNCTRLNSSLQLTLNSLFYNIQTKNY